jgi:hypothetical protein
MKKLMVLVGVVAVAIGARKLLGGKGEQSIQPYGPSDYTPQTHN